MDTKLLLVMANLDMQKGFFTPQCRGKSRVNRELLSRFLYHATIAYATLLKREPQEEGPSSLINVPRLWFTVNQLNSFCGRKKRDTQLFQLIAWIRNWGCKAMMKCLFSSLPFPLLWTPTVTLCLCVCVLLKLAWWGIDS